MLNDKNSYENRNLSDVFKELQAMQHIHSNENVNGQASNKEDKMHTNFNETLNYFYTDDQQSRTTSKANDLKLSHILTGCSILAIAIVLIFSRDTSFKTSYAKSDTDNIIAEYELNRHRLNIQNIISQNSDMDRVKEQAVEERDVEYETTYTDAPTLPRGEEVVTQEGILGKDKVTVVKTYENGEFVEEIILSKENILEPTPKLINLGTSDFLAKHRVHIGDTMYLVNSDNLKESADDNSKDVAELKQSIDVKLLDLPSEEWCKVSFDGIEGYMKTSILTSSYTTPNIVEKSRIQRLLLKVNVNMELNKTSGLTLADYKKIFTGLSNDKNKVFENNYQVFYNIEKKYNINGIFLASMAIHESAWGTSQISQEKNNLFGYGSYDNTPYESSYDFSDYSEGIETIAKSLVKYYLNPSGTKIYDGETANGWYYNGPTLSGVNTRYASDQDWHTKVFNYMQMLYNRL